MTYYRNKVHNRQNFIILVDQFDVDALKYVNRYTEKSWRNISTQNVKPELVTKQVILHELYTYHINYKSYFYV